MKNFSTNRKIDVIVWKSASKNSRNLPVFDCFKIDVIVWKFSLSLRNSMDVLRALK